MRHIAIALVCVATVAAATTCILTDHWVWAYVWLVVSVCLMLDGFNLAQRHHTRDIASTACADRSASPASAS